METVYQVRTEGDVEGKTIQTLGFAKGKVENIRLFFESKKYYNLYIEPISIIEVRSEDVEDLRQEKLEAKKKELLKQRKELQKQLDEIDKQL